MKNVVVVLLVTVVSVVLSKPIEESLNHDGHVELLRPKRQLPDEVTLNQQFFENIFKATRISRDTSDNGNGVPTIALQNLINSVEHTLIHSAQNLALSNATGNYTNANANAIANSDSNNTSHIQHIILPIKVPTPEPKTEEFLTESEELAFTTETDLIRDDRSDDESGSGHIETDFETVKPIENSNVGLLFPISLNPSANISRVVIADKSQEDVPVTEETSNADQSNITIHHTINSTQVIPTDSDVVHVHQQQITFFSANAGVFPNIHAVNAEDLPSISQTLQSSSTHSEDCSGEENSNESADGTSSSEENSSADSSSEENEKTQPKPTGCAVKSSVAPSKPTDSTTPSAEAVKKLKTEELKEQIAEVEADPVILTQGI